MATEILLPKIGFAMNEGVLTRWLVEDGATVAAGQPLYELESEKSVQEVEAPASGRLRIIAATGETLPVGTVLGEIDESAASARTSPPGAPAGDAGSAPTAGGV